ncbi:MAG TPA: hypothetical protein VGC54_06320 [Planctomycetota bacterium]
MAFLAGVDEAGYGPLLGPLTVGYSLFRAPDPELDLWGALPGACARAGGRDERRIRVDDSKKVHAGPRGRDRLERSVAAFLGLRSGTPVRLRDWIEVPPAGESRWYAELPWYAGLDAALCPSVAPERVRLDATLLGRELARAGCGFVGLGARAVPATEWNALLDRHGGKGGALLATTLQVLQHLLGATAGAPLRVELDRHSGRTRYAAALQRALEPARVEVHAEGPEASVYTLHFADREVQMRFRVDGDSLAFPTALASMAAKLTRERVMDLWNDWFGARLPDLRPTKGYAKDGRRWLEEAAPDLPDLGLDPRTLRRRL